MPNSEAEKDAGAGAAPSGLDRAIMVYASENRGNVHANAFVEGWDARGRDLIAKVKGTAGVIRCLALDRSEPVKAEALKYAEVIDEIVAGIERDSPSPAPTDTKEGTTKAPE